MCCTKSAVWFLMSPDDDDILIGTNQNEKNPHNKK